MKRLLQKNMVGVLSLVLGLLVLPSFAQADGMGRGNLIVQETGDVSVTFAGSDAKYTSNLYYGDTLSTLSWAYRSECNFFCPGRVCM